MLRTTTIAATVAALAVPAVAEAARPAEPGAKGRAKAEQQRGAKAPKTRAPQSQRVGFTLSGPA